VTAALPAAGAAHRENHSRHLFDGNIYIHPSLFHLDSWGKSSQRDPRLKILNPSGTGFKQYITKPFKGQTIEGGGGLHMISNMLSGLVN